MKKLLIFAFIIVASYAKAQDTTQVEAPKIVGKLNIGKKLQVGDLNFTFLEVVSDSRCPEGVNCVWAGEAKVIFQIEKNGKAETKQIILSGNGASGKGELLFQNEILEIFVHRLQPYPKINRKIKPQEYYLELYMVHSTGN